MKASDNIIAKIKEFEGFRGKAYKALPSEKYYTIGYGHMSPTITENSTITQPQAHDLLIDDLLEIETAINQRGIWSQNEFDALCSFTYNCGVGNLDKLIKNRTHSQIADAIPLYCHAGGRKLSGLVKRRDYEAKLFRTPDKLPGADPDPNATITASTLNIRLGAGTDNPVIGVYQRGDRVRILETWYKTNRGWISSAYVDTD